MFGSLFMGCSIMYTTQNLSKSSKVREGMPTDEVLKIMGEPVISELDRNVEEWHYCKTGFPDTYLAIFFVDNKVSAKTFYTQNVGVGDCSLFVKTGDYIVPPEIQAILEKNTPTSPKTEEDE